MTEPIPRRVGLLGGSFDPVHNAHLALAHAALQALQLDEVRWVPTGQPWQKLSAGRSVSDAVHRVAMLELALAGEPRFRLDRIELERSGPSYMIDTVLALHQREPGTTWVLLIGQDQHARLHTWHRWHELLAQVELAVARRPGTTATAHPDVLRHPAGAVPLPLLDVSSSDIRHRVATGQDISALVPPQVARYIESHGLYRGTARTSTGA